MAATKSKKKGTGVTKRRRAAKAPSPAQLRARRAFAAAARARSKAAKAKKRAAKKAAPRRRNKTIITKPKRVVVLNGKKKAAKKAPKRRRNLGLDFIAGPERRVTVSPGVTISTRAWTQGGANRKATRAAQATNPKRRRRNSPKASPKVRQLREMFTGIPSRSTTEMYAPDGTPRNLGKLGKFASVLMTSGVRIKAVNKETWLCTDAREKMHLATKADRLIDAPAKNWGEIDEVEYIERKPKLGYTKKTLFFHELGEETGERPCFVTDGKGGAKFKGGAYRLTPEGIVN